MVCIIWTRIIATSITCLCVSIFSIFPGAKKTSLVSIFTIPTRGTNKLCYRDSQRDHDSSQACRLRTCPVADFIIIIVASMSFKTFWFTPFYITLERPCWIFSQRQRPNIWFIWLFRLIADADQTFRSSDQTSPIRAHPAIVYFALWAPHCMSARPNMLLGLFIEVKLPILNFYCCKE